MNAREGFVIFGIGMAAIFTAGALMGMGRKWPVIGPLFDLAHEGYDS